MAEKMPPKPEPFSQFNGIVFFRLRPGAPCHLVDLFTDADLDAYARSYAADLRAENERLRRILRDLVVNEGAEAYHYLDRGIGTKTGPGRRWLAARAALGDSNA